MSNISDYKRDSMQTVLGSSVTNIDDLEKLYLAAGGATSLDVNKAWHEVFLLNGASSANWNTAAQEFLLALGATSDNLPDNWTWFWVTNGGSIAPSVTIVLNSGASCDYEDPDTTCSASGTYEANDSAFTNPADTWLWTIESGAATITGSAALKTVVIDTGDVAGDVAFSLKVVATDSVSTDTANIETVFTQTHTDISPPVFAGTVPAQTWLTTESASLALEPYFSNPVGVLTFAITAGSLPTGVTLNTTTGLISGTPTVETTGTLTVSCTNAYGTDSTNSFGWESTAAVAEEMGMVVYNGTTAYYGMTLAGAYSGNLATAVFRFNIASFSGGGSQRIVAAGSSVGGNRLLIQAFSNDHATTTRRNKIQVFCQSSTATNLVLAFSSTELVDGADHVGFVSYNSTAGTAILRIDSLDELDVTNPEHTLTTGTLAGGGTDVMGVGAASTGTNPVAGNIGYVGYHDAYLTNWSDFMDGSVSKDIDEVTWTEWGAQPLFWNRSGVMDANAGSAGSMAQTAVNYTIGDAYDFPMMTYDGSTGYYSDTSVTTANNTATLVARFNVASFSGGGTAWVGQCTISSHTRLSFYLVSNDYATVEQRDRLIVYGTNSAGTTILRLMSDIDVCDSADHTVFCSWDSGTGVSILYIDGVEADDLTLSNRLENTGTMDTGTGAFYVGGVSGGSNVAGDICSVGLSNTALTNPEDFMLRNTIRMLDQSTWTEWGGQPLFWHPFGTLTSNIGSAGAMTKNGTITGPS